MTTGRRIAALRRADRALVGAAVIAIAGVSAPAGVNLYTDKFGTARAHAVQPQEVRSEKQIAEEKAASESYCLAQAMYYEARGEGEAGAKAVAEVVMARVKNRNYPKTICGVVLEGSERTDKRCQFSFTCDGSLKRPKDVAAWKRAHGLADKILAGSVKLGGQTDNAIAYHSVSVAPEWADEMLRTTQIGNHIFYRRMPLSMRFAARMAPELPVEPASIADIPMTSEIRLDEVQPEIEIAGTVGDGA